MADISCDLILKNMYRLGSIKVNQVEQNWFNNLYVSNHDNMVRFAARLLNNNVEVAQEMVQEVFLLLIKKLKNEAKMIEHENPGGWLYVTLKQLIMNERKKHKYKMEIPLLDMHGEQTIDLGIDEILPASLKEDERMMLIFAYKYRLSTGDIAKHFNIKESVCKMRLYRLRKKIKKEFKEDFS